MNFDRRSLRINTELGLIIDSPQVARAIAARFDAITQPSNSYEVVLAPGGSSASPTLQWRGLEGGNLVSVDQEPGVKPLKRSWIETLSLLPLEGLL